MKKDIHPVFNTDVEVVCSCGNKFTTGASIKGKEIRVETCHACHPFYTGEQKLLKTGAIDRFQARMQKTKDLTK